MLRVVISARATSTIVIPGCAVRRRPGIHTPDRGYGFRARRFAPPRNEEEGSCSAMSFITGVGLTAFGRHEGSSSLDLMSKAAELAIADAGLKCSEIDGILCGYSTVAP